MMSKPNYYGAYGRDRAGIYTSYEKLKRDGRYIKGLKQKGFIFKKDAVQFVVDGLSKDYKSMNADDIDTDLLRKTKNWNYSILDLKKRITVAEIVDKI